MRYASNTMSFGLLVLAFLILIIAEVSAAPTDEKAWLFCLKNEDCTSVQLGCWYWQPVNKKYSDDMQTKYAPACLASLNPGPQPEASCKNGFCVNNTYTVKYWKQLDITGKNGPIDKRIDQCLQEANIQKNWGIGLDYVEFRQSYLNKVDTLISKGAFEDDQPLNSAIESIISCEDVVAKIRSLKK